MVNMVAMIQLVYCVCVCSNTSEVMHIHSIFLYLYFKDFLSGIIEFVSSYIYTRWSLFCGGRFFFLMQLYSFFHTRALNRGETEGYVLTAKEIAVKRSLHLSFSPTIFFFFLPVLLVLLAFSRHLDFFKRHFISLSCSYSQGKGGKSCTVFLFYPP